MAIKNKIHPSIKKALKLDVKTSDKEVKKYIRKITSEVCKPCWEIKYCPYGPLVEQFPILPSLREESIEYNNRLKSILANGKLLDGRKLDAEKKEMFENHVNNFNPNNYPTEPLKEAEELSCNIFGHICPVFFTNEGFTETTEERRRGRYIAFKTKMRVVRRDNHTCQHCSKHLRDDEVEFDHIIPLSKGGSSEEYNIRLTCFKCNRDKKNKVTI